MKSEHYPHKVAAIYPDAAAAKAAVVALDADEADDIKVMQLAPDASDIDSTIEPETQATRDTVAKDTVAGVATGTAAGAVTAGVAAALTPALFVSAPLVGPLVVLGYGAMIGGTAGAIRGLKLRENMLSGLVKDTLKAGYHVVIVHAASEEAQQRVEAVIDTTVTEDTMST